MVRNIRDNNVLANIMKISSSRIKVGFQYIGLLLKKFWFESEHFFQGFQLSLRGYKIFLGCGGGGSRPKAWLDKFEFPKGGPAPSTPF